MSMQVPEHAVKILLVPCNIVSEYGNESVIIIRFLPFLFPAYIRRDQIP